MLEVVVFAVSFVVAQLVAGLILFKLFTSERFMKRCIQLSAKMAQEINEEMEDKLWD